MARLGEASCGMPALTAQAERERRLARTIEREGEFEASATGRPRRVRDRQPHIHRDAGGAMKSALVPCVSRATYTICRTPQRHLRRIVL